MDRITFLAERIREVFLNGKRVAYTNYKELLLSINWEQALQKVDDLNTIALLTFHVNYYLAGVLKVLQGGKLEIRDKYSFDLPEIRTEKEWEDLVNDFLNHAEMFAKQLEQIDDEMLDKPFVEEKYGSYLQNIELIIEHSYYHLGQISLIKKMIIKK